MSPNIPFVGTEPVSVGVQSVLYLNEFDAIERATASLARSVELARFEGVCSRVSMLFGDSSPVPCLSEEDLKLLRTRYGHALDIRYDYFDGNLGSAKGHNRLAQGNDAELFLIRNPDVIVCPRLLELLIAMLRVPSVGMVEAKQLPVEHPKEYDTHTGETGWATTACAMFPADLFRKLGGFDADAFFLYCDDVDFSWLVRLAGYKVVFQPSAVVFHDKRLSNQGRWQPSAAERYYSAEAALMLAHKWSQPDLVKKHLEDFRKSGIADLQKAHDEFVRRKDAGTLPKTVDPLHKVGLFVNGLYAKHRYPL
jgi:GT2 family glycosyltransferase